MSDDEYFSEEEAVVASEDEEEGSEEEIEYDEDEKKTHDVINIETRPEYQITSNVTTAFEIAKILASRAEQIDQGAPIYIDPGIETDSIQIAIAELKAGKCPLSILRSLDDTYKEQISANSLTGYEQYLGPPKKS